MSNDESAHCCVLGEGGSLLSSAVTGLGGARSIRLAEGGFVIEHIHATEERCVQRAEGRVGTVGITSTPLRRIGQPFVRIELSLFRGPSFALFDAIDFIDRNVEEVNHVASDVRKRCFLSKEEAARSHAV